MADQQEQSNIKQEYNNATVGLNQDQTLNQIKKGTLTYALNAAVENFDASSINYQNEVGNELCLNFPNDYVLIGTHFIVEKNKHIFFMTNPTTGASEIGYMDNEDCTYHTLVSAPCLNFDVNHPIHKAVHKITNCTTEIYWTDGYNPRRYLDIDNIPRILESGSPLCGAVYIPDSLDCNALKIQPNFSIPQVSIDKVTSSGNLIAGTYQFAVQYSDAAGNPYTSYYSVTNPTPIADIYITNPNYNYPVGKSIVINVDNLDTTGFFNYFNVAVIRTINGASNVELLGTYYIENATKQVTYTGQGVENIHLSINDIFEKYPYYDIAEDLTAVQDILVWDNLTSIDRINYQSIATKVDLKWETWRIPSNENYSDELNATNLRGYLRDEVYAFELVFLLKNGKQTDGFHIPGRVRGPLEARPDVSETNNDFVGTPDYYDGDTGYSPYWKIYNTGSVTGYSQGYKSDSKYKGPYQYGEFAYWESTEEYPCNKELWGDLAGQKIRHHKFPDVLVSPIYESKIFVSSDSMAMGNEAIFPIGVNIDVEQIRYLINHSDLTTDQKNDIIGFKIVRGDRASNKSIVAKGILRNIGKYKREDQEYYFPNYPYNDLSTDPFLNENNNAYAQLCNTYDVTIDQLGQDPITAEHYATVQYTDCNINKPTTKKYTEVGVQQLCSIIKPVVLSPAKGSAVMSSYEVWSIWNVSTFSGCRVGWEDPVLGITNTYLCSTTDFSCGSNASVHVVPNTNGPQVIDGGGAFRRRYEYTVGSNTACFTETPLTAIRNEDPSLKYRQIFNSPETSFGQPFLGTILKLENVIYGSGKAHFTEVKNNAKYRLITEDIQKIALDSSNKLGALTSTFNTQAMFAAYQSYLTIYINGITKKNFAYSYNSIADYNYSAPIENGLGIKQRNLDLHRYLIPGVQSVDDTLKINNYQRESSIFLKTDETKTSLLFPDEVPSLTPAGVPIVSDKSRITISSSGNCSTPGKDNNINVVSYYASIKNEVVNQWGQLYSYETIDTGFQRMVSDSGNATIFGGDTFISRFAFKTKLPFFIDNRVNAPDDSDIFYDEIGNVAYPKYWHSARSILKDYMSNGGLLSNIISYKAHNFDCPNTPDYHSTPVSGSDSTTTTSTTTVNENIPAIFSGSPITYYDGYFYLFAYGIPNFYCESSYNLDLRQAINDREGNFWPHVSTSIPDDWVQETFVPINFDNTYSYNSTFSKQNKENSFSHLPLDWKTICYTYFPFRTIYSDQQQTVTNNRVNNWLIYKANSYFDFPQNYGKLTSLDGIQNKAVLARFENKSLMYNNLLTVDTSNPQAAYFGNPRLFEGAPPIDFAETDLGYIGSQNKILLKIPQGQVTIDAKRGQIFLISGTSAADLGAFGSGMNRFFTDHLAFEILRYFPDVDIDNNFTGIGLHGVYDSKFDRVIISKLDYIPLNKNIVYENYKFYLETPVNNTVIRTQVYVTDQEYFCNKSWTLSYNLSTRSWISFHSYIPNWYIAENNFFYSGVNGCCDDFNAIVGTPNPCLLEGHINCNVTTTTTTTAPL